MTQTRDHQVKSGQSYHCARDALLESVLRVKNSCSKLKPFVLQNRIAGTMGHKKV